jgi:hypothetical protein
MCGAIPPLSQYVFMPWCLVKYKDNFSPVLCLHCFSKQLFSVEQHVLLVVRYKNCLHMFIPPGNMVKYDV